jgi:hypothetical protein
MAKNNSGILLGDEEGVIEPVTGNQDFKKLVDDEAFMNEVVTVHVHASANENDSPHVILNVNGTNQPVVRGVPTPMKRKYLEVLARMKETRYSQRVQNPSEPDRIETIPRTAQVYPFDLVEDKNPKGRAWLSHIMAEQA